MKINKMDIWCIISPIIMFIVCLLTKTGFVQAVASVTGVIYISLIAKENKFGYLFAVVNVIFYAILTWQQGLFGTAIFNLAYSLPVLFYGYFLWNKKQGKTEGEIKILSSKSRLKILIIMVVIIGIYYFTTTSVFNMNNALVDSIIVCFSFVGNILMAKKYVEQWIIWIALNCINLAFWSVTSVSDKTSMAIAFMWILYLLNNIFGFISWNKKTKFKKN